MAPSTTKMSLGWRFREKRESMSDLRPIPGTEQTRSWALSSPRRPSVPAFTVLTLMPSHMEVQMHPSVSSSWVSITALGQPSVSPETVAFLGPMSTNPTELGKLPKNRGGGGLPSAIRSFLLSPPLLLIPLPSSLITEEPQVVFLCYGEHLVLLDSWPQIGVLKPK